jgi:hypothetical protein
LTFEVGVCGAKIGGVSMQFESKAFFFVCPSLLVELAGGYRRFAAR